MSDEHKWLTEPNKVEFEHAELKCLILRDKFLFLGGYVGLPPGHQHFEKHFKDIGVEAHKGLTFSGRGDGERREKGYWWVGFYCDRPGDRVPARDYPDRGGEVYRDIEYVRGEVKKLAEKLQAK
ncbi:MAG: hypothetical protein V1767_03830 [Chloroflexota bacterium]